MHIIVLILTTVNTVDNQKDLNRIKTLFSSVLSLLKFILITLYYLILIFWYEAYHKS